MQTIDTIEALEALYGRPVAASLVKETDRVTPHYAAFIAASPFVALATAGPEGLDCTPRGDLPGFLRIHDEKTLMMPDRRGNNRVDSLRNIIRDPRVGLLFLIPGSGTTLRVNGRARLAIEPELLASFAVDGEPPRSVIVITVDAVYFQCARAIIRSNLWNPEKHVDPSSLPTMGQIIAAMSDSQHGGEAYDKAWPERAKKTMW
ncbi:MULTISPECIES: pyridoxamine 5'-phosphate oxidase family protein [Rhodomicrobium]|uniref:pyridoxamine 5'-phosphate oxidase family protein n=1 Tax=Rhodomicrobium TaxID=1068 RepID=UPI000B4ACBF8|nr:MULTISPECIES: pyridoxamine 5'-phosphate oxidase family protein [Rhodomicrobium]